ncbi:universal stress protein [Legionella fallonii]|uniref:Universal stress protein n=1 Tax=Legionella fallonii LLAP-10 TaxID=1212491 RepID=A0A098G961_9GAMM|nr:universal stress protein [Legionella fallonii]CEG59008.1 Universal stress protein (Usp) [Legionella fallonii LLAP-10]
MNYKNILVALDDSEITDLVLQEVLKFKEHQNSNIRLIHIIDATLIYHGGPGFDYLTVINACLKEGQKLLDRAKETICHHMKINVDQKVVELKPFQGRIAEAIVKEAQEWPADLLVMGTHGRRGFSHLLLGSVAENTIRLATMPMLLVPAHLAK